MLLRNPGPDVAIEVGERVRNAVRDLDLRALGVPGVSVSVGVATHKGGGTTPEELVALADRSAYRAKFSGRNSVAVPPWLKRQPP